MVNSCKFAVYVLRDVIQPTNAVWIFFHYKAYCLESSSRQQWQNNIYIYSHLLIQEPGTSSSLAK